MNENDRRNNAAEERVIDFVTVVLSKKDLPPRGYRERAENLEKFITFFDPAIRSFVTTNFPPSYAREDSDARAITLFYATHIAWRLEYGARLSGKNIIDYIDNSQDELPRKFREFRAKGY